MRRQPLQAGPDVQPMGTGLPQMQFAAPELPGLPTGQMDQALQGLTQVSQAIISKMAGQPALTGGPVDAPIRRPRQPFPNAQQGLQLDRLAQMA